MHDNLLTYTEKALPSCTMEATPPAVHSTAAQGGWGSCFCHRAVLLFCVFLPLFIHLASVPWAPVWQLSQGAVGGVAVGTVGGETSSSFFMQLSFCFLSTSAAPSIFFCYVFGFVFLVPGLWPSSGFHCSAHPQIPELFPSVTGPHLPECMKFGSILHHCCLHASYVVFVTLT